MISKKNKAVLLIAYWLFLLLLLFGLYRCAESWSRKNEVERKANYDWSYESACEHEDFAVAHKLLQKKKKEAISSKERFDSHIIKRNVKEHWFSEDEVELDQESSEEHESYKKIMENDALLYLNALDYVYNAEITYLKSQVDEDNKVRIEHLLREAESQIRWFDGTHLKEEADKVLKKLKELAQEDKAKEVEETTP